VSTMKAIALLLAIMICASAWSKESKRISLNFQKINVRAVLQLLAEFTGKNIVVTDKVQGDITLRLHDIPWEEALDLILKTKDLKKTKTGNVLFIDQSTQTADSALDDATIKHALLPLNYAKAADFALLVKDKQNSLLSEKGKVTVDTRTNTLWIQDTEANLARVKDLIQQFDVPVDQVLIEARIVEVSKDFSQDLGIHWRLSGGSTPTHDSHAAGNLSQHLNLDLLSSALTTAAAPSSLGIALATLKNNILLDLELSALENEGHAELISSPRLMTINQQTAVIESGEEIPYQESTSGGATAVSFKKAVLSLKVTPQLTPDGHILMDLQINQDTPALTTFHGVPSIYTKQIQTRVLVKNAQTIVLGGIYRQDKNRMIQRIPFLGHLPVVGTLFTNKQTILKNSELLIFITPKMMMNAKNK
jgi:type IV pilus assembly protein PilQ